MDDILQYIPKMLSGRELDEKLAIFPVYDKNIRGKSSTERLIALQDIYQIFVPNKQTSALQNLH